MIRSMRPVVLILSLALALSTVRCAHQTAVEAKPVAQPSPTSEAAKPPAAPAKPSTPTTDATRPPAAAAKPSTPPPAATNAKPSLDAAEREKLERRFVEMTRMTMRSTPPPEGARAWHLEYVLLISKLAGIADPTHMSDEDLAKRNATYQEILTRRAPGLLAELKQNDACRAKQEDAIQGLKDVATWQGDWHDEHGRYTAKLSDLEHHAPELKLPAGNYEFKLLKANQKHFHARATGTGDMAGDIWEVAEDGDLKAIKDLCDHP